MPSACVSSWRSARRSRPPRELPPHRQTRLAGCVSGNNDPMPSRVALLGVPTSAGAFAPGQELAPRELRRAGLVERLRDSGVEVNELGDSEVWRWRPDPASPRAQNLSAVCDVVRDTARRVEHTLADGGGP